VTQTASLENVYFKGRLRSTGFNLPFVFLSNGDAILPNDVTLKQQKLYSYLHIWNFRLLFMAICAKIFSQPETSKRIGGR
ncbi:MAG: hypothetical protein ACREBU_20675, partial [Nitrososphaera sp.]